MLPDQVLQQHGIDVHRAEVVFQNADAVPLRDEILHVAAQERRLAGAEKPSDQIDLYHLIQFSYGIIDRVYSKGKMPEAVSLWITGAFRAIFNDKKF